MRRLLISLFCGFTMFFDILAQQDPQYSHYMFNQMTVNPGYAGSNEAICLTALHRQQWVGIEGAPVTSVFTINSPFTIKLRKGTDDEKATLHGVGLSVIQDQIGFDTNTSIGLSYAYRFPIGPGRMGIGVSGKFLNKALDATWSIPDGREFTAPGSDPAIPGESESVMGFDMGFGIFYRFEGTYLGLASTHLLEPIFTYEEKVAGQSPKFLTKRQFYATAGSAIQLNSPAWVLNPSIWVHSDGVTSQFTANLSVLYSQKVWGGLGYRLNESVIVMVGVDLFNGIKVGYSFDYTYNNLRTYITAGGSHEVMLSYCFNLIRERTAKGSKSVRFL